MKNITYVAHNGFRYVCTEPGRHVTGVPGSSIPCQDCLPAVPLVSKPVLAPLLDTIAQMKREILDDIVRGHVPPTVASFQDLHDHVDANEYGGFCDPVHPNSAIDPGDDEGCAYVNAAQDAIHGWLARGGHLNMAHDEVMAELTRRGKA